MASFFYLNVLIWLIFELLKVWKCFIIIIIIIPLFIEGFSPNFRNRRFFFSLFGFCDILFIYFTVQLNSPWILHSTYTEHTSKLCISKIPTFHNPWKPKFLEEKKGNPWPQCGDQQKKTLLHTYTFITSLLRSPTIINNIMWLKSVK